MFRIITQQWYEPCHEKTCLWDFRPGKTQTGLLTYRSKLESWNSWYSKKFEVKVLYYLRSEQQRCWSDCAYSQADLHLSCSHRAKTGFLRARLICCLNFSIKEFVISSWLLRIDWWMIWYFDILLCSISVTCTRKIGRLCAVKNQRISTHGIQVHYHVLLNFVLTQ